MSDPLRTEASRAIDEATDHGREAKIEQLLLAGLDHYFAVEYEQAINVWTRALFLDRSHARARAYIERARSALAERHRECEELIHTGLAAFDRGDADEARRLLRSALSHGAPSDEALALLERLERLDCGRVSDGAPERSSGARMTTAVRALGELHPRRPGRLAGVAIALVVLIAGVAAVRSGGSPWQALFGSQSLPTIPLTPPTTNDSGLPLPRRSETALTRARALAAGGRLHDALSSLDLVRPTDPQKDDADRLRADIQRQLLALSSAEGTVDPPSPVAEHAHGR